MLFIHLGYIWIIQPSIDMIRYDIHVFTGTCGVYWKLDALLKRRITWQGRC